MPTDDLSARLLAAFLEELDEHARQLASGLLELEQEPSRADTVRRLFRSAHTIKGAAGVADVPLIERVCHELESVFASVRDAGRTLNGSEFALLFAAIDALADAHQRLAAGGSLDDSPLVRLLPGLSAMTGRQTVPEAPAVSDDPAMHHDPAMLDNPAMHDDPAAAPSVPATPAHRGADIVKDLIRIQAHKLDALLAVSGELVSATAKIAERTGAHDDDMRKLSAVTSRITEAVRNLRLRPIADACEPLPRAVRDIAAREGKRVALELTGQEVECDRMVVDALRDPLLHLVRNAVDHGIEPPAERERVGKPPVGQIRVATELSAGRLIVTVADDGAGIDEDAILSTLARRGTPVVRRRDAIAEAVVAAGFSTMSNPTAISGRGVGLDLARAAIERIGGMLDLDWERGRGTTFTLQCPPSPATLRALRVTVGRHCFAIPTLHVERVARITEQDLHRSEGRTFASTAAGPVMVNSLAALLGPPLEARALEGSGVMVIMSAGLRRAGLIVDSVIDETEIVVRPLDIGEAALPYASGAALLPSGGVALVLAVGALLGASARSGAASAPTFATEREAQPLRVLVADDSITTRLLEQNTLEAAGYEVITAVDGEDAWKQLETVGADIVVADVEMPRLDGFALCRRIRSTPRFAELPVIMVTALGSDADRARGLQAGADAYVVKASLDQSTLVETIRQMVGDP